jgi:hypothetical protein
MIISCEQYEAPCFLSSVGSEHLVYTERVTGSNPVESTIPPSDVMVTVLVLETSVERRESSSLS